MIVHIFQTATDGSGAHVGTRGEMLEVEQFLLDWLNENRGEPFCDKVDRFLRNVHELREKKPPQTAKAVAEWVACPEDQPMLKITSEINAFLAEGKTGWRLKSMKSLHIVDAKRMQAEELFTVRPMPDGGIHSVIFYVLVRMWVQGQLDGLVQCRGLWHLDLGAAL